MANNTQAFSNKNSLLFLAFQLLYTGDFSRQEDRHLMAAEIPNIKPDILIIVCIDLFIRGKFSNFSDVLGLDIEVC